MWPGYFSVEDEMELTCSKKTYEIPLDGMLEVIAKAVGAPKEKVSVEYVITEVGGDIFDRYPGTKKVTSTRVTVSE
jgi:hypothetical protein